MPTQERPIAGTDVPPFPVVRLELREQADGTWSGLVDGQSVASGVDEEVARGAVVDAAAERAASRPLGAIRAVLSGFGPEASEGVVSADGELSVNGPEQAKRSRRGMALVAGLGAVVLASVGGVVWAVSSTPHRAAAVAAAPSPTQLPVVAPAGFSAVALWSVPVPASSVGSSSAGEVATGQGMVFVPSANDGAVVALDAATGVERWRTAFPTSTSGAGITSGPVWVSQGKQSVLMAWSSDHVASFDPATGRMLASWSLASGTSQVVAYPGGVVVAGSGRTVQVFTPSGMVSRVVPAGASVVGLTATGDGIVAVGQGRVWQVTSASIAGDGRVLTAPKGTSLSGCLGVSGSTVVLAWAPTAGTSTVVQAVNAATAKQAWTATVTGSLFTGLSAAGAGSPVTASQIHQPPRGGWSVIGPVLTDVHGTVHVLPQGWTTTAITSSAAYGTTSQGTGMVTSTGAVSQASSSQSQGSSVAAADDAGHVFMVATNGSASALYALRSTKAVQR